MNRPIDAGAQVLPRSLDVTWAEPEATPPTRPLSQNTNGCVVSPTETLGRLGRSAYEADKDGGQQ